MRKIIVLLFSFYALISFAQTASDSVVLRIYYASKTNDVAFIIGKYIDIIEKSNESTTEQIINTKSRLATVLYRSEY
jgi:hypothetical protein